MRLYFRNVKIHNFLSIKDGEVDLANRGYVLVEGNNRNPKDNASSNGSGKSTIFNAICWVLTGETVQGLKSNIPNIYGEDGCFVELNMLVDSDEYTITRYREYHNKNDLKIFINGEDHSGKSLRDSEKLLSQYLPGITPELIGNVIILGQGLPHKFSNNTPAGRKEILEQLSNSDMMINDVKERVSKRFNVLEKELREKEDNRLATNTELKIIEDNINQSSNQLATMDSSDNITQTINQLKYNIERGNVELDCDKGILENIQLELNRLNSEVTSLLNDKQLLFTEATLEIDEEIKDANEEFIKINTKISSLNNEIIKLDNIIDICPTCGQKLPNVHKIDTTGKKEELAKLQKYYSNLKEHLEDLNAIRASKVDQVSIEFKEKLDPLYNSIEDNNKHATNLTNKINQRVNELSNLNIQLTNANNQLATYQETMNRLNNDIKVSQDRELTLKDNLKNIQLEIDNIQNHLNTLSQIKTLVNRDFRGLLLSHVIDFINNKSKQYCSKVFGTDDLNLYLDGNNINIDFCNKSLENLSGGEQQKINIIIQFAIRNMMCQYLNFSSNILVLDEIFDQLDLTGCSNIIDLINFAITDVESLFVISHHSDELNIPYDDNIIVEKNEKGVSSIK